MRRRSLLPLLVLLLAFSALPVASADGSGWTWLNPLPQGNALHGVWGSGPDNVYAVGEQGTIMHYNGTSWRVLDNLPGDNSLLDVWGNGVDAIFAVGDRALWRYDGASWKAMTPPSNLSTFHLWGVWGANENNVYAVGYTPHKALILRYTGNAWSQMNIPYLPFTELYDVWGSSPDNVFAVGDKGAILHYDGQSWKTMSSNTEANLRGIWGAGPNNVYAVGWRSLPFEGVVLRYDGHSWQKVLSEDAKFQSIWGFGPDDIYLLDDLGNLYHFDGQSWQEEGYITPRNGRIYDLWGTGQDDIFVVGEYGILVHFDGSEWQDQAQGPNFWVYDVWTDGTRVVSVGNGPSALVYDGTRWIYYTLPFDVPNSHWLSTHLYDLWGTRWDDLYAVGDGIIWHFNGRVWRRVHVVLDDEGTIAILEGIWGFGPNDIYVVGGWTYPEEQVILHFDGAQWSTVYRAPGPKLLSVWGSGPNDVFVAAGDGGMLHYNGQTWRQMDTNYYDSVWGLGPNDVYATGQHPESHIAAIFHYDGAQWRVVYAEDVALDRVWGLGPNDIYAVGVTDSFKYNIEEAVVLHYDGSQWRRLYTPFSTYLWNIHGTDDTLIMVGRGTAMLGRGRLPPLPTTWVTGPIELHYLPMVVHE